MTTKKPAKIAYADALKHFKRSDPILHKAAHAHRRNVPSRLKRWPSAALFDRLASSIAGQQLSTKAAATIRERVRAACGGAITADAIAKLSPARLRAAGLSGAKTKSLKELAKAVRTGKLDLPSLSRIPEAEASEKLTAIWGIGPWTAEMFLMFALGRTDVFSPGDLGLRRAMEELYGLKKDAPHEKLHAIAQAWSPYRTYACLVLWSSRDNKPA